jgi:NRAMP (natural resistance-associated macrophage protein)-like metal ion transporter
VPGRRRRLRRRSPLDFVGPGLITGAADDDPSGIATYAQAGAQFGYSLLWTALFAYPLMTAVQEACARIGAVTGGGLVTAIQERFSRPVLYLTVALVLAANTINVGADLGGMAAALRLVLPVGFLPAAATFAVAIVVLEVVVPYRAYAGILKWLSVSLLAYAAVALLVAEPWSEILKATFVPRLDLSFASLFIVTGVLGTTISPYMFFWEASEEVEEEIAAKRLRVAGGRPRLDARFIRNLRIDNLTGMFVSQLTSWFIIVSTATVLHSRGVSQIATAADAAHALEPLVQSFPNAGLLAKLLFAAGVIGLGLLAVPVLAGSASYALCEAAGWREGLYLPLNRARGFYAVIALATLLGLGMNFLRLDPVQMLVFAAVFNGVAAAPLIFLIGRIAGSAEVMGEYRSRRLSRLLVGAAMVGMAASALAMLMALVRR